MRFSPLEKIGEDESGGSRPSLEVLTDLDRTSEELLQAGRKNVMSNHVTDHRQRFFPRAHVGV